MPDLRYKRRIFDENGKFVRTEIYNPVRIVGPPDGADQHGFFVNADAQKTMQPAYREQTVKATHLADGNIIPFGAFPDSAFAGDRPIYWTGEAEVRKAATGRDNDSCMEFRGRSPLSLERARFIQSPEVLLRSENALEMEFSFDFRMRPKPGVYRPDLRVYYVLQCGDRYFSADEGHWQMGFIANFTPIGENDYSNWITYKVLLTGPPADGMFSVRFYEPVVVATERVPNPSNAVGYFALDNISARLLYNGAPPVKEVTSTQLNSKKYSLVPETDEITHADLPDYLNAELIYPYAWKVIRADGSRVLTKRWKRLGYEESVPLIEMNLDTLVDAKELPTRQITGTVKAPFLLSPHHYIQITYDDNRVYKINGYSWDVRAGEYEVELMEVVADTPIRVMYRLLEDGRLQLLEDGRPKLMERRR